MKDYKRLTERRGNLVIDKCGNCENVSNPQGCTDKQCYEIMKNRLAELEEKIESGTLIELPCKVGDTVFTIDINNHGERFINEARISEIVIFEKGIYYNDNLGIWIFEIFLTREEAERRLKELQNEK